MKTILLFLFLLSQYPLTAQTVELEGNYSVFTNPHLSAESIEFRGTDSFYYRLFACGEGASGRGVCEIVNNYLYLYFSKEPIGGKTATPGKTIPEDRTPNGDYTIRLHIFEEKYGDPVPFAQAVVKGKRLGAIANASGDVLLKLSPLMFPAVIGISATGYVQKEIMLSNAKNYEISVQLNPSSAQDKVLSNGEVYKYELGEISEDSFEARPAGSKEKFLLYKKNNRIAFVCPD